MANRDFPAQLEEDGRAELQPLSAKCSLTSLEDLMTSFLY
jgi:hypothetical protein